MSVASDITAQLRTGGRLILPSGEYVLTESIVIGGNATLEGAGFSTRLNCTGDFPAIKFDTTQAKPVNVIIRNLRITRTNTVGAAVNQWQSDGIQIWGTNVTVEDVWIEDCYKHIATLANLSSLTTQLKLKRISSSNSAPTVYNSHSGIYLGDVDDVTIEQWPSGPSYYPWFFPDPAETVTNVRGVAKLFLVTAPAAKSVSAVHANFAGNNASLTFPGPITNPVTPRNVTATFGAAWDGGNIRIDGTDQFDQPQTQYLTAQVGTTKVGQEVFKTVTAISKSLVGAAADACSIGTGDALGVTSRIIAPVGALLTDDAAEAVTVENGYHSFTPTSLANGARNYKLTVNVLP